MGQHGPKTAQRRSGHRDAELGDVAFEEGCYECLAPHVAVFVHCRQIGSGQAAAQPQLAPLGGAGFGQIEPADRHELHAPGQGFRDAPDQIRRGAAEDQEARGIAGPIRQHAQRVEQAGLALNLVQHHQAALAAQRQFGIGEGPCVRLGLQVEEGYVAASFRVAVGKGPRQCRLAALAGAEQGRDGRTASRGLDLAEVLVSGRHARIMPQLENPDSASEYS